MEELDFGVRDFTRRDLSRLGDVADCLLDRNLIDQRPPIDEIFAPDQGFGR